MGRNKVKRSLAMILSSAFIAGTCVMSAPKKAESVNAAAPVYPGFVLGSKQLSENVNTSEAPIVFFGEEGSTSKDWLAWKVIGYNGTGIASSDSKGSAVLLYEGRFDDNSEIGYLDRVHPMVNLIQFNSDRNKGNAYSGSDLQSVINGQYTDCLSSMDVGSSVIRTRTLQQGDYVFSKPYSDGVAGPVVTNAKLWPLSAYEAYYLDPAIRYTQYGYWLRSPAETVYKAGSVNLWGEVDWYPDDQLGVTTKSGVRPAFFLNLSSVLFTSPANDGKVSNRPGPYALNEVKSFSNPYHHLKLTIKDPTRSGFTATANTAGNFYPGNIIDIRFSGARDEENEYVSAFLCDNKGNVLYYGRLVWREKSGIASVAIPNGLADGYYVLKVFSEKINGERRSDLASDFVNFDIAVGNVTAKPTSVKNLKATSAGKNQVKLSWDRVPEAEGYLVYAQKNGIYGFVGMSTRTTTFTDRNALDQDYNYYWVFPYVKDEAGNMIVGNCEKYVYAKGVCMPVTGAKITSRRGYAELTWNASEGADGYLIYGIRPGESYGYIGMTTGTRFRDTYASTDEYTFYWIYAYHESDGKKVPGAPCDYIYGRALPLT